MHGKLVVVLLCLALGSASCAGSERPHSQGARSAARIVTLMPSFAADLCAMGEDGRIVGVSQYGRSASCAANAPEVANFASVDTEKILELHPDAVVAIPAQRRLTEQLQRAGIRTLFLPDDSYGDIFSAIERLGRLTGNAPAARALESRLRSRTRALQASEHGVRRPRVFLVIQAQPVWTAGPQSYISTLLRLAGARNAVSGLPRPYAQYSAEALIRLQPDAIVAGRDTQLASLLHREPWRSLRAVREGHVYILNDPALLERPGPNYNEGISWLIRHLRPLTR